MDVDVAAGWEELNRTGSYEALGEFFTRLGRSPGDVNQAVLMGAILQKRGEWSEASRFLLSAAERLGPDPALLYEAALNAIDAGEYEAGAPQLTRLLQLPSLTLRELRGVWRAASLLGMHELARTAYSRAVVMDATVAVPALAQRMSDACDNQAWGRGHGGLRVVSLGENCLPFMVMNRWGLQPHPVSPDADCIFNLAQSSSDGCTLVVSEEAGRLVDEAVLQSHVDANGSPMPHHPAYNFLFNHEQGTGWAQNGFERLKGRYGPRIETFKRHLDGGPRLLFHFTETPQGDLDRLVDAVAGVNRNDLYRLVIVDTCERTPPSPHPTATYVHVPKPSPDYIWFKPDHLESEAGLAFERAIVEATKAVGRTAWGWWA